MLQNSDSKNYQRNFLWLVMVAAFLMAVLATVQPALADNVYASIRGVVTDPSGAAVPNVTLVAANTDTGIETKATSGLDGVYVFPQLQIGNYKVTAKAPSFKTFQTSSFLLTVNEVYNLPVRFELGSASETVEVSASTIQVETTNIQLETLVDDKKIVDLPLINRNWTSLEQLTPGVVAASDRFGTYSANGSQSNQSSYLINGIDSNDLPLNSTAFIPSPDALQEFNIITNTINPEYGRNSGAIVNTILKSGTNEFHGDAFEFYRDTFLNTANWLTHTAPQFHQNDFGGTIGGPIWKNHTFAFFSFEGEKNRRPQAGANSLATVFSNAQRGGNFSGGAGFNGVLTTDPTSGLVTAVANPNVSPLPFTGDTASPCPGSICPAGTPYGLTYDAATCVGQLPTAAGCAPIKNGLFSTQMVPTSNFDSVANTILTKYIPGPNSGTNQFTFNPTETGTGSYQYIARIDHTFNASNSIWGTMFLQTNPTFDPIPLPLGAPDSTFPGLGEVAQRHYKQFIAAWNHTFNSSTLNEFRVGYTRFNFVADQPAAPIAPSSVGFNINSQITSGESLPLMNILGAYQFQVGFTSNGPQPRKDQTRELTDNFSKVIGKHAIKAGFDFRRFDVWNPFAGNNNGTFSYNAKGGFSTRDAGADFLLGIPDNFSQGSGGLIIGRAYEYYSYIQDQWKVKSNLTVTLGTGWQIDSPLHSQQFGGKDVTCFRPGQQSTAFPNAPAGMLYPGDHGCDNTGGQKVPYTHFGPRVGFAWAPEAGRLSGGSGRLSIRGGWGFYYNRAEEEGILQNLGTPPFSITSHGIQDQGANFSPGFANPYGDVAGRTAAETNPFPFVPPTGSAAPAADWSAFEPLSLNVYSPNFTTPEAMNYNLTVQRQFASNTVFSIGYVGALGRHLFRPIEGNPITLAGQQACLASLDPVNGCAPSTGNGNFLFQHQLFPTNSVYPGNVFGSVGTQSTDGNSTYNALQIGVNKGFSHGFGMLANFTWSHAIDNGSGFEDSGFQVRAVNPYPQFASLNKGDSSYDARKRFVAGFTYQTPSLHGNQALNMVAGGWELTGITTFQTGFPVNISDSGFTSATCDVFVYYDCWDSPVQIASLKTGDPRTNSYVNGAGRTVSHVLFNGPATYAPATPVLGGPALFGVGRNGFHGPGLNNWDIAIEKNIYLRPGHESQYLQLRLEGFNVFNHTQFCATAGPFPCINNDVESGSFGQVRTVNPSRLVQLGAKFYF